MRDPAARGWPERGRRTDSRGEAEEWSVAYRKWAQGELRRVSLGRDAALHEAVREYLTHRSGAVERATWSADRTALGHLKRAFTKATRILDLEPPDVQRLVDDLLRQGYRPSTVRTYVKCWRTFLRQYGHDPALDVKITSKTLRPLGEIATLTVGQVEEVFDAARKVDAQQIGEFPSAVLACAAGLYMGLRQGEIFALQWPEISQPEKIVRVSYQVPKDSTELRPTKGKYVRAALVLPGWWEHHRTDAIGFVCGRTGRPVGTRTQRNLITRVLDTAGLNRKGLGYHIFRHTYAMRFLEAGGSMEELQKSLGHSSVLITQSRYDHWKSDRAAARARSRVYGQE